MDQLLLENAVEDLEKLTKTQLSHFIDIRKAEVKSNRKDQLLATLLDLLQDNEFLLRKIYKQYECELGIHPKQLEETLNITKTERLRWTEDKRLKVVKHCHFRKWGKDLSYPLYDAYQIRTISPAEIEKWRLQHQQKIAEKRKTATQKAIETRIKNKSVQVEFYNLKWKKMLKDWYLADGKLGASLQLAFWTMWISRWAKEFQTKSKNARVHKNLYNKKQDDFYQMKNEAIQRLILSPFSKLSFYQPLYPDKITNLTFCPHHFELWMQKREFDYVPKWDFYYCYQQDIHICPSCTVEVVKNYYSLYFLSIKHNDYSFSFHTPHPIGKSYLPSKDSLPQITHEEQEGLFRFGRTLFDDEKIIFTENEVRKYFEEALVKFDVYFGLETNSGT